ncbi:MAG: 50S ribosomal protein L18 [Flavobacteriia bacterium]|jgi:large subunit ribosomal protein L18
MAFSKLNRRAKIKRRIRKKVSGTAQSPRLTVFRSNKQIYAQLIDDSKGVTLVAASSYNNKAAEKLAKVDQAAVVGKEIAEKAIKAGISTVVFDRNGYLYHGRVKSLADSAREGGLKF